MMIHISRDGDLFGPYCPEQGQEYLAAGQLLPTDMAWYEGAADWVPVTEVVAGATAAPPSGVVCTNCGAAMEADQVICLACGQNLDEPKLTEEQAAADLAAAMAHKPIVIPPPYTYEDETADRAGAVNSIGWALMTACLLPVFGGGDWVVSIIDMWSKAPANPAEDAPAFLPYTWQMMFDILAPGILGLACIILASASHGRARGVTMLVLMCVILGLGLAEKEAGTYDLQVAVDTTPALDSDSSSNGNDPAAGPGQGPATAANEVAPGVPKATSEKKVMNIFYEKLKFNPGEHAVLMFLFLIGWVGTVFGAKARLYRPDSKVVWIAGMVGGVASILFWFMPSGGGIMLTTMTGAMGDNLFLGLGLLLMFLLQVGAAVCCFINTRRIRPSLMKKYANLAVSCAVAGVMLSLVPAWGKVIFDETKEHHAKAKARYKKVEDSLEKAYIGSQTARNEAKLAKVEIPTKSIINSVCGWLLTGVKYLAWLGGLLIVLPLSLVEILCGRREPDAAEVT